MTDKKDTLKDAVEARGPLAVWDLMTDDEKKLAAAALWADADRESRMVIEMALAKEMKFRPQSVRIIEKMNKATVLTMTVREGKVRQVRRMFGTLRHKILLLRRIRIGDIRLADLPVGSLRPLTGREIQSIRDLPRAGKPVSGS